MNTDYGTRTRRVLWLGVLAAAVVARAAEAPTDVVRRTDAARVAAMMAGDGAALGRVFSDEVVFVHSDGRVENKGDYIKNMTAGDTAYTGVKTSEVQARQIAPDVIVLIGGQEMRKKLGATWSDIRLRFMSVWRNEAGAWRMIAWQSMKPSGSSIVPPKASGG